MLSNQEEMEIKLNFNNPDKNNNAGNSVIISLLIMSIFIWWAIMRKMRSQRYVILQTKIGLKVEKLITHDYFQPQATFIDDADFSHTGVDRKVKGINIEKKNEDEEGIVDGVTNRRQGHLLFAFSPSKLLKHRWIIMHMVLFENGKSKRINKSTVYQKESKVFC